MPTCVLWVSLHLLNMLLIKVKVCLKIFDGCSQVRDGLLKEKQARVEKARWEALNHWGKSPGDRAGRTGRADY